MSVIVANVSQAGRLKPDIRLAQSVSRFKQLLSSEQKVHLEAIAHTALSRAPEPSDVMQFTAELNRQICLTPQSRCYGPRFTNFLQSVQQFAALGDVVVGGSQNILACSIWSLVRMSILATINITSYFETLSLVFMEIGRTAPRHQALALLYRRSPELQACLCEYFIVVVDLCFHIMKFTQSSLLRKMVVSLNDAELKTFRTDLRQWSGMILEEVNLRLVDRVELEAHENSKFRIVSRKRLASISHERHLTTYLRILDRCSQFDYETAWKQLRKQGNTGSFSQTPSYKAWRNSTNSNTLAYHGKLGCGKSVLMANLVEELVVHVQNRSDVVTYFFCQHDIPESLLARTIIAALTRQLLQLWSRFDKMTELVGSETRSEKLLELLWNQLPDTHRAYIVVDGLDLCRTSDTEQIISWLRKLQAQHNVLLCISSRLDPGSGSVSAVNPPGHVGTVPVPDNTAEIETYIDRELERCLQEGLLAVDDPSILPDLREALSTGAQGMFLWVSLQIKVLCAMQTDQERKEALKDLPQGLIDIYQRAVERERQSKAFSAKYQERIFTFTTTAWRPLTLFEMREALSITVGDIEWDRSKLPSNVHSTLSCCGCLIVVDEEELTVRSVHPSVETYLLERYTGADGIRFSIPKAHSIIADHIITYLSYAAFQGELSRARIPEMNVGSAPSRIFTSTLGATSEATRMLALRFLKAGKNPSLDVRKTLAEALQSHRRTLDHKFHFHEYARRHCVLHLTQIPESGPHVVGLLPNLLARNIISINEGIEGFDPLAALARSGNMTTFELLYIRRQDGSPVRSKLLDNALRSALIRDDSTCIPLLVKSRYITFDFRLALTDMHLPNTPLWHAVQRNSVHVADKLLQVSNMTDAMFTDAIKNGFDSMARLLFENRPRPAFFNLNFNEIKTRPLWLAVTADRPQMVEMLAMANIMIRLTVVENALIKSVARSSCVAQLLDVGFPVVQPSSLITGNPFPTLRDYSINWSSGSSSSGDGSGGPPELEQNRG